MSPEAPFLKTAANPPDLLDKFRERFVVGLKRDPVTKEVIGRNALLGSQSALAEALRREWAFPSRVAGAPFRWAGGGLKNIMLGRPEGSLMSPVRGKRLRPVPGGAGKGLIEIGADEYGALKERGGAELKRGKIGGRSVFYKRKYIPGGLVGGAMKHPVLAGGGALLAYYLMKNPSMRAPAGQMATGLVPQLPHSQLSDDVARMWGQQRNQSNPLQRDAW